MDRSQPASVSSFNAATLLLCLSVAGKTRTLLELLSWTYGLYFEAPVRSEDLTAAQTLLGSCDMATVAQSLDASFDEKRTVTGIAVIVAALPPMLCSCASSSACSSCSA